jgi:nucleoid-associated protein YejK
MIEISSLFVEYNLQMEAAENIHLYRLLQAMATVPTLDFQNFMEEKI